MKIIFLLFSIANYCFGQDLHNSSFENWNIDIKGNSHPTNWEKWNGGVTDTSLASQGNKAIVFYCNGNKTSGITNGKVMKNKTYQFVDFEGVPDHLTFDYLWTNPILSKNCFATVSYFSKKGVDVVDFKIVTINDTLTNEGFKKFNLKISGDSIDAVLINFYVDWINIDENARFIIDNVQLNSSQDESENVEMDQDKVIFPNPFCDFLDLRNLDFDQGCAMLYNENGILVKEFELNNDKRIIDTSKLHDGKYILKVFKDNTVVFDSMLIKQSAIK